jgi:hypothetical protein
MPNRSGKRSGGTLTRRVALGLIGGGALLGITSAGAFDQVEANRGFDISVADETALVGIVDLGPVKKNSRDPMVELTNNTSDSINLTVSLTNCADGQIYDNEGGSGCSITVTLASGNAGIIDITAATAGTISYDISAVGDNVGVSTTSSVEAESGTIAGAVRIQKPLQDQDFTAAPPQGNQGNRFEIKQVDVQDDDSDDDLVEVAYEVREGSTSGTVVAQKTVSFAATNRYKLNGNPAETITPNSGYTIQSGQLYTLTVTGTDADGNFATSTVQDTA